MNRKKIILGFLLFFIFFNFYRSNHLFDFKKLYRNFDFKKYEKSYNLSQWVVPESKKPIGDDIIYAYAGASYVRGKNPILINSEHPPLAKNLIGLSAVYLGNEYYFSLFSGLFAFLSFCTLTYKVLKSRLHSFLIALIVALEPLFVANYFLTLLDLLTFAFLNLYFYFLPEGRKGENTNVYLSSIFLGLIISTKFYGLAFPLILSTLIYFFVFKKYKTAFHYLFGLIISLSVLVVNYFQFFKYGNSLTDFLKLQKYIYVFHSQGRRDTFFPNFSFPSLIFTGRFFLDKTKTAIESHHSFLWAASLMASLYYIVKTKINSPVSTWILVYTFIQLFSITNARYLIILIPYLYLSAFALFTKTNPLKKTDIIIFNEKPI